MSEFDRLREKYGYNPAVLGMRYWGKYEHPFEFNIAVNEMDEVTKHQDVPLIRTEAFGIQSSLNGGFRVEIGSSFRNNARRV